MRILITGATGYIGGRLVQRLLDGNHRVRVLVRNAERIRGRSWADRVEIHTGDLLDAASLESGFADVDVAYYLVHSMDAGRDFAERDRSAAHNYVAAAHQIPHTIYLGGLLPRLDGVSAHLGSRAEVGRILRAGLPTTELRAGPIIGSGSASFEMIRYLTERLPAMVAPRWIENDVQPIGIRDVLSYLVAAAERDPLDVVEIGADRLSFRQTMEVYAEVRGLRRRIVPVPVLAPGLASLWVGLVTPIPNRLARPLIEGVIHPVVADTRRARSLFPEIRPIPYREAVGRALARTEQREVPTRWSGAGGAQASDYRTSDWEGLIREVRSRHVAAPPVRVFRTLGSLGGSKGWLVWGWAWRLRGLLDRVVGGPGLRRGRRDPEELLPGEALDFWRVERVDPPLRLRLRAEMKVPGAAWLEWTLFPEGGGTRLVQTASFAPHGLAGALYWYGLYPIHRLIFSDLVAAVAREAEIADAPAAVAGS
jgi:uncharacterized protein YbjT (DUF2867 family)/uncharacterized protein YndB with AHSA1/START domain